MAIPIQISVSEYAFTCVFFLVFPLTSAEYEKVTILAIPFAFL